MSSTSTSIIPIIPYAHTYDWGKLGNNSLVGLLKLKNSNINNITFNLNKTTTYAELWMGTHNSGMSYINNVDKERISLLSYLSHELPFLFKILSVNKALSIQAHPNKSLALILNKNYPQYYKDSNHKPEMTIALTKFETMCGFRDVKQIITYINTFPELKNIIGDEAVESFISSVNTNNEVLIKEQLKIIFSNVMNCM